MKNNNFKISRVNGTIIIEKDGQELAISQAVDEDIWFTTSQEELLLEISMYSRIYPEWQTYMVFESLMKSIVGRYMLNGDNKKDYTMLPEDFVDLDNKVVTWHSDSATDNVLRFGYNERTITISISKSKDATPHVTNAVRIRTSGSNYEYYYQEFLEFFRRLNELEHRLNKTVENAELETKEAPIQRELSLFGKHKNYNYENVYK